MFAFLKAGAGWGAGRGRRSRPHISLGRGVASTVFHSIFLTLHLLKSESIAVPNLKPVRD